MSQVITNAFENYWQSCLTAEQPVVLDEFILADIPNLDITSPIDPDAGLPPESQIVHRQNVDQRGRINNNAVAYTIVMDTTVGDFSFNAMYLRNKANGVIGMIVYKGRETKLKTDQTTGQTGNSLVKSMLMGYDQAAEATLTNVDAGTWQIDYAARLRGMDEDIRQLQADLYGHHTFVGDGFKVVEKDGAYQVSQGVAIVGGLRVELKAPEVIHPGSKPIGVWVDVHRAGSLLSEHQNHFTIITSVADLTDHVDSNGYQHYVAKLATVLADGAIEDGREVNNDGAIGGIDEVIGQLDQADKALGERVNELKTVAMVGFFNNWKVALAERGIVLVDGSFEEGASTSAPNNAVMHYESGVPYILKSGANANIVAGDAPNSDWVKVRLIEPLPILSNSKVAHRCLTPENTILALGSCAGNGFDAVETDAKQSSDGVWYIFHDDAVDNLTNGTGVFSSLGSGYINSLRFESLSGGVFMDESIPLVSEFIDIAISNGLTVYLEIKSYLDLIGIESLVKSVSRFGVSSGVVLCSMDISVLRYIRFDLESDIPLQYIYEGVDYRKGVNEAAAIQRISFSYFNNYVRQYPDVVNECSKVGINIFAWTILNKKTADQCARVGATNIVTDILL